ncbi:hypothetical protein CR513_34514, partial [Mucuna pruriens]
MEFEDNLVQFNIFDTMRHPTKDHSLYTMDVIDELVEEYNYNNMTILNEISNMFEGVGSMMGDADSTHINGVPNCPNSSNHPRTDSNSVIQGWKQTKANQTNARSSRIHIWTKLNILQQHKKSIWWKLSNLPGINPSIYMHRIIMEEEACPIGNNKGD